jgi:integrase
MFTSHLKRTNPTTGHPTRSRNVSFKDYFDDYASRQIWSPQSARTIEFAARTFPYAHLPLRQLRHEHIETWVKTMHDDGLAPATVRTRFATIRAALYAAMRDGLLDTNPAIGVRLPRATGRATRTVMPSKDQVATLIRVTASPYDTLFALCAYAGLRLGEARALTWDDIDLDNRVLTVRQQLRLTPGGGWETAPPKYGSYRSVPIAPELGRVLARHPGTGPELAVHGPEGAPVHPGSAHLVWTRQRASCGLPRGLRLHDLRHFYASRLIADRADILTVQRRLGHARASTTLDVYAHQLGAAI